MKWGRDETMRATIFHDLPHLEINGIWLIDMTSEDHSLKFRDQNSSRSGLWLLCKSSYAQFKSGDRTPSVAVSTRTNIP